MLVLLQRQVMVSNITSVLIPFYQQNRAVVGLPDGGLANPMPLLFDPTLGQKPVNSTRNSFMYPQLSNVSRPSNDSDTAYMTVCAGMCLSAYCHGQTYVHYSSMDKCHVTQELGCSAHVQAAADICDHGYNAEWLVCCSSQSLSRNQDGIPSLYNDSLFHG